MFKQGFFCAVVAATTIATSAVIEIRSTSAHHGWSEYNNQKTLNLTGQIQSVSFGNPHTSIQLKAGNKVWTAILAPSSRMERRGLPNGALKKGQTVQVVGYPHQSDTDEMRAERIIIGDRTIELR